MNDKQLKKTHKYYSYVFLLSLSILFSACDSDNKQKMSEVTVIRPVKTITVESVNDIVNKSYPALVLATQQVDLSFRVSGKLQKLPIKNGIDVKKGDVIAKLDERDFKANITRLKSQINQANAQMKAMRAGARPEDIASLQAVVKAAQAEYNQAKTRFYRTQALVKKQVIARNELDKDKSALEVAKANLSAKNQDLRKGKAGGRKEDVSAQIAVVQGLRSQLKSLEDTLSDATLRAPFDGTISSRKVENFANIQANTPIATIQKLSEEVEVVFNIPATDIAVLSPIREQLQASVVLDSLPNKTFVAKESEFSTEADSSTQTYEGRAVLLDIGEEPILPGMTGTLNVIADTGIADKYVLPLSAIASHPSGAAFVWVVDQANKVSKRDVTLSEASGNEVSVLTGISLGDVIITAGLSAIQDGMVVKPITAVGE